MKWISCMYTYMQLSPIDNFSRARHCSGNFHIYLLRQFSDPVEASNISISLLRKLRPRRVEWAVSGLSTINKVVVQIRATWLQDPLLVTEPQSFSEKQMMFHVCGLPVCWEYAGQWLWLGPWCLCWKRWERRSDSSWILKVSLVGFIERGATAVAASPQSCPTLRPHRRQPTRLPRPWDSPGRSTGVSCHFLLQCMKVESESEVA